MKNKYLKLLKDYIIRWWRRRHCAHLVRYTPKSKYKGCPYVLGFWEGGICPPCNHYKPRKKRRHYKYADQRQNKIPCKLENHQ